MIAEVEELAQMMEFRDVPVRTLERKLKALEDLIRAYTNNNFQNRKIRFAAPSSTILLGYTPMLSVGDTVQINESINDGLYVIRDINKDNQTITLNKPIHESCHNLVTKVEYPDAIIDGVINLMIWEVQNRDKVGVQSETLSRHSVTYFAQDANNQLMGYPISLLGFLKPYNRARF